jgi:hypothetical protein
MTRQRPALRWELNADATEAEELADRLQREGAMVTSSHVPEVGTEVDLELTRNGVVATTVVATVRYLDAAAGIVGVDVEPLTADQRAGLARFEATAGRASGRVSPLHQRLRALSSTERQRLSRNGEQAERVLLERIYGKAVWEALLQNPRITPPEVARIARMGALPRPLLEQIASNPGWLGSAQVRRAVLSNPRLGKSFVLRVLQALPKHDLRLMEKQTAYPAQVVALARDMLGRK